MKNSAFKSLALITAAAISVMSCKKNNDTSAQQNNNNPDGQQMAAFMKDHGPKFEDFTVDAAAGATFTSSKGIKYTIPAGAFVTAAGGAVTGSVTVSVKEITTAADMILADKPTLTSDGQMLLSYGEFFVKAAQNNLALLLKRDSAVKVQVPAKPVNGVQEIPMWDGDSLTTYTLSGYDYLNTAVTISVQAPVRKGISWNQISASYAFFNSSNGTLDFKLDSLVQWRNCDQIVSNAGPKTTLLGYFNSHYNSQTATDYMGDQPSMLYFKPHNQNILIKLYDIILKATGSNQGFISYEAAMPVGMQGTFLAISTENGKFYADMKDGTIAAPTGSNNYSTLSFDPQEVSESTMVSLITQMSAK
ncbi:MAG TPA: hypothetical protein VK563_14370 [Puia sp.]|nr:hypothetical protein [Puia sp.]